MKNAEQMAESVRIDGAHRLRGLIDTLKIIQLDAFKAGMKRASSIVNDARFGDDDQDLRSIKARIETEANNLAELP